MSADKNGWHPIETAPKHHRVDLWYRQVCVDGIDQWLLPDAFYARDMWNDSIYCYIRRRYITHWRYPPKPPAEFEENQNG